MLEGGELGGAVVSRRNGFGVLSEDLIDRVVHVGDAEEAQRSRLRRKLLEGPEGRAHLLANTSA